LTKDYDKRESKPKSNLLARAVANFSQIGVTIAATIIVGVLLGKFLDSLFGTTPWLLLVFSLLGVGAAFKGLLNLPEDQD